MNPKKIERSKKTIKYKNLRKCLQRNRQAPKRKKRNYKYRSILKNSIKNIYKILVNKNISIENLITKLKNTYSIIDKIYNKGIIHRNKAARYKKRINIFIKKNNILN